MELLEIDFVLKGNGGNCDVEKQGHIRRKLKLRDVD